MVKNYILDSNILIGIANSDGKILDLLLSLNQEQFNISVISRLEVLIGFRKHVNLLEEMENFLDQYPSVSFDESLCREAAMLQEKSPKKLKFKDLLIAATAILHKKTLITSDKDFLSFKNLKVKYIKP